jgi:hypothetical protein
MKRNLIIPAFALLCIACKDNKPAIQNTVSKDTAVAELPLAITGNADTAATDTAADEEISTFYIVMADTGKNYYQLHDDMVQLSRSAGLPVDTMGRGYDAKKNLICLPENDEDEAYAGDYYPRRFPSVNLSLEYLYMYKDDRNVEDNTIALVAGIFETRKSADSLLQAIRPYGKRPFVEKAKIYTGCMH